MEIFQKLITNDAKLCGKSYIEKRETLAEQRYSVRDKEFRANVKHACPRKGRSFAHFANFGSPRFCLLRDTLIRD